MDRPAQARQFSLRRRRPLHVAGLIAASRAHQSSASHDDGALILRWKVVVPSMIKRRPPAVPCPSGPAANRIFASTGDHCSPVPARNQSIHRAKKVRALSLGGLQMDHQQARSLTSLVGPDVKAGSAASSRKKGLRKGLKAPPAICGRPAVPQITGRIVDSMFVPEERATVQFDSTSRRTRRASRDP